MAARAAIRDQCFRERDSWHWLARTGEREVRDVEAKRGDTLLDLMRSV